MVSPATLGIIGALTGIVGAITWTVGSVLGWISYRRSQQIKRLDLRLELRKQVADVRSVIDALPGLLERSQASHIAVLAAMGMAQSGASESWMAAWKSDFQTAKDLAREAPDADETYQHAKHQDLETKLVEVHTLATKVVALRDKYLTELASDDKEREYLRADFRARFISASSKTP